jgi:hypothetical protein
METKEVKKKTKTKLKPKPSLVLVSSVSETTETKTETKTETQFAKDEDIVRKLSNNYTTIISRDQLKEYKHLDWGDNGIGDRWANKKYNYTVIYHNKKTKTYSENDEDCVNELVISHFIQQNESFQELNKGIIGKGIIGKGIIGIFVHSKRKNVCSRPIRKDIDREIKKLPCVSCGSHSDMICDHKNDIYNDEDVLNTKTQKIEDFQPLCNHCNLQKRQIFKNETKTSKLFSAKNFQKYQMYAFEFPWEKKAFELKDINTKKDTYWYDPVEFNNKIYLYMTYRLPIVNEIKQRVLRKKIITHLHI